MNPTAAFAVGGVAALVATRRGMKVYAIDKTFNVSPHEMRIRPTASKIAQHEEGDLVIEPSPGLIAKFRTVQDEPDSSVDLEGDGGPVINATAFPVSMALADGTNKVFAADKEMAAVFTATQTGGEPADEFLGQKVVRAGRFIAPIPTIDVLPHTVFIVGFPYAQALAGGGTHISDEVKSLYFGRTDVRIVVADSGPKSAIRDSSGKIIGFRQFTEYTDKPLKSVAGVRVARAMPQKLIKPEGLVVEPGSAFILSRISAEAASAFPKLDLFGTEDVRVFAPDTNPATLVRDEKGDIFAVPGLVEF